MTVTKRIEDDVLGILSEISIEGAVAKMVGQLDRKMYVRVNKILEMMGGKWNRKLQGHVFLEDPTDLFETVIVTGEITDKKKLFQFYETPLEVVDRMIELADLEAGMTILEPSAGKGAIIKRLPKSCKVIAVELNKEMADKIATMKNVSSVEQNDFLKCNKNFTRVNRVIMNPPFTRQQDIDHVIHAFNMLKNDGKLVSVMSMSFTFSSTKKAQAFRDFMQSNDSGYEVLSEGSFKTSGTMIRTTLVWLKK